MTGSVNKVFIVGRVGKDPVVRATQNGKQIASLTVATNDSYKDKASGERKENTEWHKVVAFGFTADFIQKYVTKGALVSIVGKLQTRKWQDKQTGQDRYMTEIVADDFQALEYAKGQKQEKPVQQSAFGPVEPQRFEDDDIPF